MSKADQVWSEIEAIFARRGADTVLAEVARTSEERAEGLMYREEVAEGTGMLFVFPDSQVRSFWMANTYVALDIGYMDPAFRIVDIVAMEPTSLTRDFQCVTGWRVHDVAWKGVRLADVLDRAGVRPEARAVRFTSFDGAYSESLTLPQARRRDVLVAYELEGSPLSDEHGGPVRLYVAPMYGYKSLKWLDTIVLTKDVQEGYWEVRGYDVDGWVGRSNGRDDDAT